MKTLGLFSFLFLGQIASAAAALQCTSVDGKYLVTVAVSERVGQGMVFIDGQPAQFGDMTCQAEDQAVDCHSNQVADAGYHFIAQYRDESGRAKLSEYWIGGEKELTTLTCTVYSFQGGDF